MTSLGTATLDLVGDGRQLDQDLGKAESRFKGFSDRSRKLGVAMSGAISAPIIGLGAAAFAAANTFDEAMKIIQTGTGATGDDLADLERSFQELFTTVPASAETVATALADLNTMTGLTGDELEHAARVAIEMSDAMGLDLGGTIASTTKSMLAFGEDTSGVAKIMDFMFTTSQDTGVGVDELGRQLTAYGPVTKNLGLSMEETIALFGDLGKEGIAISRIMPGINAFMRRAAAGQKKYNDMLKGTNPTLAAQQAASFSLRGELDQQVQAIKNAETEVEALSLATDAFGAEGAQRLTVAIRNGSFSLDELATSAGLSEGAVLSNAEATRTAGERFAIMKNEVTAALVPLGEQLMGVLERLMPHFETLIGWLQKGVDFFGQLSPNMQIVILAVGGLLAVLGPLLLLLPFLVAGISAVGVAITIATGPVGLIVLAIAGLIAAGILLWKNWDLIKKKAKETWEAIREFFVGLWESLVKLFKDNWELILAVLFPPVGIALLIKKHWGAITDVMRNIWDAVVQIVRQAVNNIISLINSVIQAWNELEFGVGPFKVGVGKFSRTVGPWHFGTPNLPLIPHLATGGIAMGPMLAMIGEDGPEAVVPLNRANTPGLGGVTLVNPIIYGFDEFAARVREVGLDDDRGGREIIYS